MPSQVLDRFPQLRRISSTSLVQQCVKTYRRQRLVTDRARFVVNDIRGGSSAYDLAADRRRRVLVRHRTRDMEIFDEIFGRMRAYEPPAAAAARLSEISAGRPLRVLDLGGNIGLFAVDVLARHGRAEITSYERDPTNMPILRRCVAANEAEGWSVVQACAMPRDGTVRLAAGNFADSYVNDSGIVVTGIDVLPLLGMYDFVKIDIEGSEWPILNDDRWPEAMQNVAVLVMEWHKRGCPSADHRTAAISAVTAAGYTFHASDPGWDHGLIWGWRASSS
jgi:FkbM family methyltransferase